MDKKPKKKGIVGMAKVLIGLAIAAIVLTGVVMPQVHPVDSGINGSRWSTNWSVGELALFGVIGIVAMAVLIFSLM